MPYPTLKLNSDHVLEAGCEGILSISSDAFADGDVLAVPSTRFLPQGIAIAPCLLRFVSGSAVLGAFNTTNEPILLSEGTTIASVADSSPASVVSSGMSPSISTLMAVLADMSALTATLSRDLTPIQAKLLLDVLAKHRDSFDVHSPGLTQTTATKHRIETDGSAVIRRRPYRVSSSERKIIQDNVGDMFKRKVILPSTS